VERGDTLRILQNSGVVIQAVLKRIIRRQHTVLRQAVIDLSQGQTEAGFDKLDYFGAVHEFDDKVERLVSSEMFWGSPVGAAPDSPMYKHIAETVAGYPL